MTEPTNQAAPPIPVAVAMLLCDQMITDKTTGKNSVIGIWDHITAHRLPTLSNPTWIYLRLMECEGEYKFRVELIQVATQQILRSIDGFISNPSRHNAFSGAMGPITINVPNAGEYEIRLWMNDIYIQRARFVVDLLEQGGIP